MLCFVKCLIFCNSGLFCTSGPPYSSPLTIYRISVYWKINIYGYNYIYTIYLKALLICLPIPAWQNNNDDPTTPPTHSNNIHTQSNTQYLSQLSEALSPHFLPVRISGIRLNWRSITMSEHLKSQSRFRHMDSDAMSLCQPLLCVVRRKIENSQK